MISADCSAGSCSQLHVPIRARRAHSVHVCDHAHHHEPERAGAVPSDQLPLPLLQRDRFAALLCCPSAQHSPWLPRARPGEQSPVNAFGANLH